MTTYKIIRHFQDAENKTIKRGLTLEEAQEHCRDPETSSRTCTNTHVTKHHSNANRGAWFDGYEEE